jgi:hypothetical protein
MDEGKENDTLAVAGGGAVLVADGKEDDSPWLEEAAVR